MLEVQFRFKSDKVGFRMSEYRWNMGLSLEELSKALNYNGSSIRFMETGDRQIRLSFFIKWCAYFKLDWPNTLLDFSGYATFLSFLEEGLVIPEKDKPKKES